MILAYAIYYSIEADRNLKYDQETIEMILNQRNFLFFELAFTFRVGWEYIKIHNQISASYISHPYILTPIINFSTDVVLTLTNRYTN